MFDKIFEILLPSSCIGCGEMHTLLCDNCKLNRIQMSHSQYCHVCKKKVTSGFLHKECKSETFLDGVVIACKYSHFIEQIIAELKYKFFTSTTPIIVDLMESSIKFNLLPKDSVFTFVPLYKTKKWSRGFNQTELIAKELSKRHNLKVEDILKRKRNTKTQVGMSREERIENLKDVFEVKTNSLSEKIVIIDDVMTSGTTLEECAKVLKAGGVNEVYGFVLARG